MGELIPCLAVQHLARSPLANPAHSRRVRWSELFHPTRALALMADQADTAVILAAGFWDKRAHCLKK
jgi:hypothetical protein